MRLTSSMTMETPVLAEEVVTVHTNPKEMWNALREAHVPDDVDLDILFLPLI